MATSELTEEYRCGYCLQDFNSMIDPRELPCHHVFCLRCLQGDFKNSSAFICLVCKSSYETLSFEKLAKATITGDGERLLTENEYVCGNTECGEVAVGYCVECEDMICDTHQQEHNRYFKDRHKVLLIKNYVEHEKNIKRLKCPQHNEVLGQACKLCDKLICIFCDTKETCKDGKSHDFHGCHELEADITTHYSKLQESLRTKLTDAYRLQKKAWCSLGEEEDACKIMKSVIDKTRDEQIKLINDESEKLKIGVDEYLLDITDQVEMYSTELVVKCEGLENQQKKLHTLVRNGHIVEQIQQRQALSVELNESFDENFKKELHYQALIKKGIYRVKDSGMPLALAKVPSSVTYLTEQDVGSTCYTLCFNETGDMLIGTQDGVKLFNMTTSNLTTVGVQESVSAAALHCGKLYTICTPRVAQLKDVVRVALLEYSNASTNLFEFARTGNTAALLAVSDQYVIASNPDTSELIMYNTKTRQETKKKFSVTLRSIKCLPDNSLLIVGNSTLRKYTIQNGELSEIWRCDDVYGAVQIDYDADGLIYVHREGRKSREKASIVSPDGKQLRAITNDKLANLQGPFSIRGDILAGVGWSDKKLHIFKINR